MKGCSTPKHWQHRWNNNAHSRALRSAIRALTRKQSNWEIHLRSLPFVEEVYGGRDLRGAPLGDLDLRGADLRNTDLRHADLSRTDLRCSNLEGANLRKATLCGAVLDKDAHLLTIAPGPKFLLEDPWSAAEQARLARWVMTPWYASKYLLWAVAATASLTLIGWGASYARQTKWWLRGRVVEIAIRPGMVLQVQALEVSRADVEGHIPQYEDCVLPPAENEQRLDSQLPASCISQDSADMYCQFIGMRLPTEREWVELAQASGTYKSDGRPLNGKTRDSRGVEPVREGDVRIKHLAGNIAEWTSTTATLVKGYAVVKGGSYLSREREWALNGSDIRRASQGYPDVGFRCVAQKG